MSVRNVIPRLVGLFVLSLVGIFGYAVGDYLIHKRSSYAIAECNGDMKFADLRFIRELKLASAAYVNPDLVRHTVIAYVLKYPDFEIATKLKGNVHSRELGLTQTTYPEGFVLKVIEGKKGEEPLYCVFSQKQLNKEDVMEILFEHPGEYVFAISASLYKVYKETYSLDSSPVISWGDSW